VRTDLPSTYQVFLNYPFDQGAEGIANAMHFAVVAAGLLPVCAKDLTSPDRPRLAMLVETIGKCHYSAHDFSRCTGEGPNNLARFNMPVEMGMALFNALQNQRAGDRPARCAFFVPVPHDYKAVASDFAGLDPFHYESEVALVGHLYEWLRDVLNAVFVPRPTAEVIDKYQLLLRKMDNLKGSGRNGRPSHHEAQEVMFQLCSECEWWDWRMNRSGKLALPIIPLSWKEQHSGAS
jgi:hypothetical protein